MVNVKWNSQILGLEIKDRFQCACNFLFNYVIWKCFKYMSE